MTIFEIAHKKNKKQIKELEKKIDHLKWIGKYQDDRITNLSIEMSNMWEILTDEQKLEVRTKSSLRHTYYQA